MSSHTRTLSHRSRVITRNTHRIPKREREHVITNESKKERRRERKRERKKKRESESALPWSVVDSAAEDIF